MADDFKKKGKKGDRPKLQDGTIVEMANAKSLPSAIEPEKSILSSMLQDPTDRINEATEAKLSPDHFYLPAHGILYRILQELVDSGKPVELVALHQVLSDRNLLESIGGCLLYTSPSPRD